MEIYEEILQDREAGARRLVAEYRARLTAAAMLLCKDPHTAEDLVFRAFEQAILKIRDFRPSGSFYYWIYTILLNFWRMDMRKRKVRPEYLPHDELPEVADEAPDPLAKMMFAGTVEAVRTAVQQLPDAFREVVVLRYFEDLPTAQIALMTGESDGTIRSRLHYAREALFTLLSSGAHSADFADRLVRATRRRGLLKRGMSAAVAALAAYFAIAAGSFFVYRGAEGTAAGPAAAAGEGGASRRIVASGGGLAPGADAVDRSIERALGYLRAQQRDDGSFPGGFGDSAAVSSLAGMAVLSKGYLPDDPQYGPMLLKCLDFVLTTADLGERAKFRGYMGARGNGRMYAHSIATLFLAEMSGMVDAERQAAIDRLLPLAVKVIVDAQNHPRRDSSQFGGWRYFPESEDSDLSCSGWALMALRSARLNGANVSDEAIAKAVLYIKRTQNEKSGAFSYQGHDGRCGESLSGAAILCLELCGRHLDPDALRAQAFIAATYRRCLPNHEQCPYAVYYTAQGLFQLGGGVWREFEAWMHGEFIPRQLPDGSWKLRGDNGSIAYATAMMTLAFTVPYRMLPIYQRDETVDPEAEIGETNRKGADNGKGGQ